MDIHMNNSSERPISKRGCQVFERLTEQKVQSFYFFLNAGFILNPINTPARAQNSEIGKRFTAQSRRQPPQNRALTTLPAQTHQCDVTSRRQSGPVDVYVTSLVGASQSLVYVGPG